MASLRNIFGTFAGWVNIAAASPLATVLAFALVVLWAISGPRMPIQMSGNC